MWVMPLIVADFVMMQAMFQKAVSAVIEHLQGHHEEHITDVDCSIGTGVKEEWNSE